MMKILKKEDLPQKYEPKIIEYTMGIDNIPEWPEIIKYGYTWDEHFKLLKLYEIERLKYLMRNDDELNHEDKEEVQALINQMIEEYNQM